MCMEIDYQQELQMNTKYIKALLYFMSNFSKISCVFSHQTKLDHSNILTLLGLKSAKLAKGSLPVLASVPVELANGSFPVLALVPVELANGSLPAKGSLPNPGNLSATVLVGVGLGVGLPFGGAGRGGGCFLCFGGNAGVDELDPVDPLGANGSLPNISPDFCIFWVGEK